MSTTARGTASAADHGNRSAMDRFLGLFADVKSGEGVTALLLMLNIFLILAGYYLLKTIREPLILASPGGAEAKSYAAAAIAALLIVLVPAYSALASRVSRVKLINGVTLFFIVCLVAFFVLSQAHVDVGVAFFIWVGIFNLMVIAQLWAFANDVYTVDQGKRLFAIVGVGASLGAIAGSFFTGKLVSQFGPYPFMVAAAVLLALCMVLTNLIDRRERREAERGEGATEGDLKAGDPVKGRSGFALVFADRYLLLIGLLMLVYNLVNTTGEYILGKTVISLYAAHHPGAVGGLDEKKVIGEFYGNYFTWVNIISALIQAFLVSRILKYLGVRAAILILPIVAFGGYLTMAFVPILALIRGVKITENSIDYSLQSTAKNALYLPTSREAKYKAKQANDTFFVRFGDVVSAGLVFAGTTWLHFAPRQFALANVVLIVLWIGLAIAIGKRFQAMSKTT